MRLQQPIPGDGQNVMTDQKAVLLEAYRAHPGRTLPNAFWKTAIGGAAMRLDVHRNADQALDALFVWQGQRLMAGWCADPDCLPADLKDRDAMSFALVHEDCLPAFDVDTFGMHQAYFRLVYRGPAPKVPCPAGFTFETVDPEADRVDVVRVIRVCYERIRIDADLVRRWQLFPVYRPGLWVWLVDQRNGARAALGIADLDPQVPEASLEWIQVLPEYRRRGLGRALVSELLRRAAKDAAFTTVSGEVDNETRPDLLYRACGFSGSDVWHLLHNPP